MIRQTSEIIKDVRIALDQNKTSETLSALGDVDTLSIDEIIKSKIEEGVRRIHSEAPVYLLDGGHHFGDSLYWGERASGWILLPDDFMRLVVFKMSDWERPVFSAISVEDSEYQKQSSRFKGVRGTSQNPVCVVSFRPEGRVLEFYSCKTEDATVSQGVYLPYPKIDEYGGIEICNRCYEAVIYCIASLVLATFGAADQSSNMTELSKTVLI